jgi:predicted metal-dependent hydrolase
MVHLNHSRRFWKLAGDLSLDMAGAKAWLARHGAQLWAYG